MPTPKPGETRKDWMKRCIPIVIEEGTADDSDQAVAICTSMWERRERGAAMSEQQHRIFRLRQAAGELRTALHSPGDPSEEREHLVVPVVALMEGVIFPVNAETPELVLAQELLKAPKSWNGEPACWDHPIIGTQRVSANEPRMLERYQVGRVFGARLKGKKLHVEAWLDTARAAEMGGLAAELLERIEAGEQIEVSVGAFVDLEMREGVYEGERYSAIWHDIKPDHLALLPAGTTGACSNEMGCGAPRAAASLHTLSADGLLCTPSISEEGPETMAEPARAGRLKTLLEQFRGRLSFRNTQGDEEEMSDSDLRQVLDRALFSMEPAYLGIESVFPADKTVVYAVDPDGEIKWLRRTYELASDGTATFGEAEEVRPVTRFEPVTAAASSCGCADDEPGVEDMEKAERVKALIENKDTPYTDCDQGGLEALSDETLTALEEGVEVKEPPAEEETPPVETAPAEEETPPVEEPPVEEEKEEEPVQAEACPTCAAAEKAKKDGLVAALVAAQDAYSEKELQGKDVEELEQLVQLASVEVEETDVNFGGRGVPRDSQAAGEKAPPPPDLAAKIKESRSN
jgi:hypothetical protein